MSVLAPCRHNYPAGAPACAKCHAPRKRAFSPRKSSGASLGELLPAAWSDRCACGHVRQSHPATLGTRCMALACECQTFAVAPVSPIPSDAVAVTDGAGAATQPTYLPPRCLVCGDDLVDCNCHTPEPPAAPLPTAPPPAAARPAPVVAVPPAAAGAGPSTGSYAPSAPNGVDSGTHNEVSSPALDAAGHNLSGLCEKCWAAARLETNATAHAQVDVYVRLLKEHVAGPAPDPSAWRADRPVTWVPPPSAPDVPAPMPPLAVMKRFLEDIKHAAAVALRLMEE